MGGPEVPRELAAALLALAGARSGQVVAATGADRRLHAALLAGAGALSGGTHDCAVAVAGTLEALPEAVALLRAGGRVAAPASDATAALRAAAATGVTLRHLVEVPGGVAWSGSLDLTGAPQPVP